ncbi:MAG: tRNA preQ1(34) S-adenosylmethionine ribosyltransferase-isomerase QueA [Acidobacteriota bacterium]
MRVQELAYELPPELIAQEPLERREDSRLLTVDRRSGRIAHRRFVELPEILDPRDLLVLNDTRVVPARLRGVRETTGAHVEVLLLRSTGPGVYEALARPGKRVLAGEWLAFAGGLRARVDREDERRRLLTFEGPDVASRIDEVGEAPLPPYIRRTRPDARDRARYQTVFAASTGAVAAPTAGLHFTGAILDRTRDRGIEIRTLTLHVGWGTFAPVVVERTEDHRVDPEDIHVPAATIAAIRTARAEGRRIVAVGTTTARALESLSDAEVGSDREVDRPTDLCIAPPFVFRQVGALLTNFHLPSSSLLMLVAAFAGLPVQREAYAAAIAARYRFYSYGDAMFVA